MAGSQCCSNPPIINTSYGSGCAEKYGGLDVYAMGSPNSKRAILLISDVFGYGAPNLRKLAGRVAASGYFVVVPDFFYGDLFVYDNNRPLAVWLKDHETVKGFEDAKSVIDTLVGKGFYAIGAAGFCWGAMVVTELAKSELIQAAVLLHPPFTSVDDIERVKSPIAILGAEIDNYSPPELVMKFEEILNAKPQVDSYVKIFPEVAHGWAVRYDVDDEAATQRAEEAHNDMLQWFAKHVK
ncbi:endo-1,3;1,4-beta-D-glucanase-like [Argentina anserina]|uniref:endo-1,3;1,4-beta-D-glucanase-like n=1 Tax=Argentina anserina TaxID=57926 RepID=UPI0021766B4E|nr:endo-1,3;1,4-beta-D-glucanase-like [Potentilla anserina]